MNHPVRPSAAVLRALAVLIAGLCVFAAAGGTAYGQEQKLLAKVVVIGVPGLSWNDVKASPELTALVNQSHVGSITVKTAGPHTCPVDGWLTISAGTRAWGNVPDQSCGDLPGLVDGKVQDWQTYVDRQAEHHTGAPLGRLAESRERGAPICGFGPGAAIALARTDGTVGNWQPEFDQVKLASTACGDAIVDAGALPLREGRDEARKRVADLVAQVRAADGWVLLVGISQVEANAHQEPLVAMQLPPDNGPRWLTSDSTRRPGLIQLTDVTATILRGEAKPIDPAGSEQAGPLDGNEIHFTGDLHTDAATVIEDRLDTNQRFEQPRPMLVAVAMTLLVAQLAALAWFVITRSQRSRSTFVFTLLSQGGFFIAVFLSTATSWWRWPEPGFSLYCVVLAISALFAGVSRAVLREHAYLGILGAAYGLLLVDGVLGTPLQFGSMFTDGPVIGGRFYGFGNSTFATLAVAALVLAGWAAQKLIDRSRVQAALAVLAIGGAAIIVDGKPGWGTDFGGIVALTPAVLLLAWLTWRGGISWKALLGICAAGAVAVSGVAFLDYLRPEDERSHFGTFVARLLDGDVSDVLIRKLQMSLGFYDSPAGWAMLVGVLLAMLATIRPDKVPSESYRRFYTSLPMIRPTLLALSACGLIGMLLNDAGVALPAIMTGLALPLLVAHLVDNRTPATPQTRTLSVEVSDG
ncbi:hypothetical protein EV643_101209 [Kribbella sp. VKM Ac-2527]|uniref:Uncharacterized protein n=1 Tax=Kribbella caucasensis TaxID=2512215 RepID=A0A4V3CB38_9ACTN|nr:hypothetical protein [Kribbella sp. VKM Ac-2527]TDO54420.1 hypothetical protein EV643_101209 [Kribbella sp. VKM Ac-2527]